MDCLPFTRGSSKYLFGYFVLHVVIVQQNHSICQVYRAEFVLAPRFRYASHNYQQKDALTE